MEPVLASGLCHVIVRKNTVGVRKMQAHIYTQSNTINRVNIFGYETDGCLYLVQKARMVNHKCIQKDILEALLHEKRI